MEQVSGGRSLVALGLTLLVVAVLATVVARVVSSARRKRERKRETLVALGFTPVAPPPELLDRLAELQPQRSGEQIVLKDVFRRPIAGGETYLFDVVDDDGDAASSWLGPGTLAVVSPALNLPYITLIPRPRLAGAVGELAGTVVDRALSWAAARGGILRVDFDDDLEFHLRYLVMGRNEGDVRGMLTARQRGRLVDASLDLVISGNKDLLTLSANLMQTPNTEPDVPTLRVQAQQLLFWFRDVETR